MGYRVYYRLCGLSEVSTIITTLDYQYVSKFYHQYKEYKQEPILPIVEKLSEESRLECLKNTDYIGMLACSWCDNEDKCNKDITRGARQ